MAEQWAGKAVFPSQSSPTQFVQKWKSSPAGAKLTVMANRVPGGLLLEMENTFNLFYVDLSQFILFNCFSLLYSYNL